MLRLHLRILNSCGLVLSPLVMLHVLHGVVLLLLLLLHVHDVVLLLLTSQYLHIISYIMILILYIHLKFVLLYVHVLFSPFYSPVLKPDFDLRKAMYDLQLCWMLCVVSGACVGHHAPLGSAGINCDPSVRGIKICRHHHHHTCASVRFSLEAK